MKAGEDSAEEQSTAQGTSGHANPVNDDLQGALGNLLGPTPLTIAASVCARMRMCTHVQGYESTRVPRVPTTRHLPAACLSWKNNTKRLMLLHFGVSTAA